MKKIFLLYFLCSIAFSQTRYDIFIPLSTGDSLDATYYIPPVQPPQTGYPALVFVHGFGQNKNTDTASAKNYAYSNYLTLCYSVRGHGKSSGLSTIMSKRERQDLKEVIHFVENLTFVDTNSIGVIGGSQGGLHALWSVSDSLSNCAIADVITPNWASNLFYQGAIKRMFGVLLKNPTVKYDTIRDKLWSLLCQDDYDSLSTIFPINRDVDTAEVLNKSIPLLMFLKYQDHYFEATAGIDLILSYNGWKKLYLGTGGHFSDSKSEEWNYQFTWITNWFHQFLRKLNTGILDLPKYTYAYSQLPMDSAGFFTWIRNEVNELPFNDISYHRFYFHLDGKINYSYPISDNAYLSFLNDYKDTSYNFESAYLDYFSGSRFDSAFVKNTLVFVSDTLNEDVVMFGAPKAKLFFTPDAQKIPINIQIYEEDSLSNKYFITRINYVGRNLLPNTINIAEISGKFHSHKFKKGSKIRIEITNIDKTNRKLLGYYPFVFPVFKKCSAQINVNSNYPSFVELPLLKSDYVLRIGNEQVANFHLFQNFPNPFNSETNIEYILPEDGNVRIKIYDILGREIKNLFDGHQKSGRYKAIFDGKNLPAGVYFYRFDIQTTDKKYTDIRKMLLIK